VFACSVAVYAATLNLATFYIVLAPAFVLRFALVPRAGRRRATLPGVRA
jgi:hypothetical protein